MNPPRKPIRIKAETQAYRIIEALGAWCKAAPGRRFQVEHVDGGFKVRLDARQESESDDLIDALSQIATVASLEVG